MKNLTSQDLYNQVKMCQQAMMSMDVDFMREALCEAQDILWDLCIEQSKREEQ